MKSTTIVFSTVLKTNNENVPYRLNSSRRQHRNRRNNQNDRNTREHFTTRTKQTTIMNYGATIRKLNQPHLFSSHMFPPINGNSRPPSEDLRGGTNDIHSASKQQQQIRRQQYSDQQRRSPLRIIYREMDYVWNESGARAHSPMKTKTTTSARPLANGVLHETPNGMASANSLVTSSPGIVRDETNQADLFLSSASKSRAQARLTRTNSHLDNKISAFPTAPIRSESYRSSHFDYGIRGRHTSSKQRSYVNSKASSHEMNGNEFHPSNSQEENLHQTAQTINQRLNVSSFDLTTSRKAFSPNKSISFNLPTNAGPYRNSPHELHRSETNLDRNNLTRFALRGTVSKEQNKTRQTSNNSLTPAPGQTTNERHPSAQSYKSRDPNVSYAYNDVKKYIEENDLMSAEKEQCIRNWIIDVEKYRNQLQKID